MIYTYKIWLRSAGIRDHFILVTKMRLNMLTIIFRPKLWIECHPSGALRAREILWLRLLKINEVTE